MLNKSTAIEADVWEDSDIDGAIDIDLIREWRSRESRFHNIGYRDGIEAGKKSSVQKGFDMGYLEGVKAGYQCGLTRGWTSAFVALPVSAQRSLLEDDSQRVQLAQLHEAMSSISSDKAMRIFQGGVEAEKVNESSVSGDIHVPNKQSSTDSTELEKLHHKVQSIISNIMS